MSKMTIMNKNLLLLLFLGTSLWTTAQNITFGAEAGLTISGALVKYPPYPVSHPTPLPGIQAGVYANIHVSADTAWTFRPELFYSLERASSVVEGDKAVVHVS